MATSSLSVQNKITYYEKKRNKFLFFVISGVLLSLLLLLLTKIFPEASDIINAILMFVLIGVMILTISIRSKIMYLQMNINYLKMILDNQGPIKVRKQQYTTSWIKSIEEDGFIKTKEYTDYQMYHKFSIKNDIINKTGHMLTVIIIAKNNKLDFYNEQIDKDIQQLYFTYPKEKRVKKQVVLQYKKFDNVDTDTIESLNNIINFKSGDNHLIHINIGYFENTNEIYFLRAKKRHPNRYYYYVVNYILKLAGLGKKDNNE